MIPRGIMLLPGVKRVLYLLFSLTTLRALLIITQTLFLSFALVGLWQGEGIEQQLVRLAVFLICFIAGEGVGSWQEKRVSDYAASQAERLRDEALQKIFTLGPELTKQSGTGNLTTIILDGIEQIESYIRILLPKITALIIVPALLLITVFVLDWVSGLVLLLTVPVVILFMILLGKMAQHKAAKQYKVFQTLSNHFIDSLRGIDTLKLFGIGGRYATNVYKVSERFRKATMETLRIVNLSSASLDFFSTLSIAIMAVLMGIRLLDGSLSLLPALMSLIMAPEYFRPIREYASDYHASLDGKNALEAVQAILNTEQEPQGEQALPKWTTRSVLSLAHVHYAQASTHILNDLSFEVQGMSKIGIIGMSGAGKTSLINILSGFCVPDSGTLSLDGQRIPHLKQRAWQDQIIYLPQDPYIFHASLRENIAFYHPEATEAEIEEAVMVAGLHELVEELPCGLNTKIGEGARALSGGQAQRVALARMCLSSARPIMLFDEPTAHLDIETELELKERMLPLMQGRLVFFATHRLHWMQEMDYLLVMEKGRIVEAGTLDELISKRGVFASMIEESEEAPQWHA